LEAASELVRLAGISCVRDRFSWSQVEPQKGAYKWGRYDTSATIQHQAGLTVYQVFHDCPTWASGKKDHRHAPANPQDMGDFFRNMVGHFKDRVKCWEIWNEPDIEIFYIGKPEEYAAALKATYPEIKKADPQAKVLVCSFALAPGEFAEKIFQAGIADSFDIYNVHYYGDPIGVVHRLRSHKKLMEKHGVEKPIWVTEMGAVHPVAKKRDYETLKPEAAYLVKAYVYGLANGAERFFYFIFSDYDENGRNFGTVNRDFTPRPAYVALCNLTYLLGEGKFLRKAEASGEGVECYVFQDGEREVAVVWAKEQQETRFVLNATRAEAFDVIGRRMPFKRYSDGRIEIQAGADPVFLKAIPE
jgi:polysaccharide biosynthesis protein PslG